MTSTERAAPRPSGPQPPIPLTILTGYLGAGKTTLLNALLKDPALADSVVIVNEFGEVGIDHLLVEETKDDLVLLGAGCLCCTVRGDLISTLEDLLRRRDNGRIAPFRRIVIETTGLADPAPVLNAVLTHPYLRLRYALDGLVTVIDAVNGTATLAARHEAMRQAAAADRIVLTKTDLADAPTLARIRAILAELAPGTMVLDAARGEANAAALIELGPYDPSAKMPDVAGWLQADAAGPGHAHSDDVNRHGTIRTFTLRSRRPISSGALDHFLDLLRAAHGEKLLRMKGLVRLAEDPERPVVLHAVQHLLHPPVQLDAWPDADRTSRLVFILDGLDADFVERLWAAFLGEPRIDAPDRAALTDNPLSLRV